MSKLNPYAAEYVPLSKRQVDTKTYPTEKGVRHAGATVESGNLHHITHDKQLNSHFHAAEKHPSCDAYSSTCHSHSYSSSLQNTNPEPSKHNVDGTESEIDLEYLQGRFPSVSYQFLMDAYLFLSGDVEATVDMVMDLENGSESSEILPETLDIGDFTEPVPSADDASLKLKSVATETSSNSLSSSPRVHTEDSEAP